MFFRVLNMHSLYSFHKHLCFGNDFKVLEKVGNKFRFKSRKSVSIWVTILVKE